jgi:hypothetical protein
MDENKIPSIDGASLLDKNDTDIESTATIAYFIYVGSMLIPYA